jgi:hypothetical protein
MALEPALQPFVDAEILRHTSTDDYEHSFVIDSLSHKQRTGMGWQQMVYVLVIQTAGSARNDPDKLPVYEIREETEYQGGETLVETDDVDDVVAWIEAETADRGQDN